MSTVTLCDVAPRDGLQNHAAIVDPGIRSELVDRLAATGLPRIEAVSFVNPARMPQMAGAEEVVAGITRRPGVVYAGLVLNEKGYDRLVTTALGEVHFAFAASETFNLRNQGAAVADSVDAAMRIVGRAREDGLRSTVTISTAFPEYGLRECAGRGRGGRSAPRLLSGGSWRLSICAPRDRQHRH
jgi:isopropylmalate/homocitrate/citramalate synthase